MAIRKKRLLSLVKVGNTAVIFLVCSIILNVILIFRLWNKPEISTKNQFYAPRFSSLNDVSLDKDNQIVFKDTQSTNTYLEIPENYYFNYVPVKRWNSFYAYIHKNPSFSDAEKIDRVVECYKDETIDTFCTEDQVAPIDIFISPDDEAIPLEMKDSNCEIEELEGLQHVVVSCINTSRTLVPKYTYITFSPTNGGRYKLKVDLDEKVGVSEYQDVIVSLIRSFQKSGNKAFN